MLIHTGVTKRENGTGRRTQQVVQWQFSQLCHILSKREGATRRRSLPVARPRFGASGAVYGISQRKLKIQLCGTATDSCTASLGAT